VRVATGAARTRVAPKCVEGSEGWREVQTVQSTLSQRSPRDPATEIRRHGRPCHPHPCRSARAVCHRPRCPPLAPLLRLHARPQCRTRSAEKELPASTHKSKEKSRSADLVENPTPVPCRLRVCAGEYPPSGRREPLYLMCALNFFGILSISNDPPPKTSNFSVEKAATPNLQ
jgi:hypothetical protein